MVVKKQILFLLVIILSICFTSCFTKQVPKTTISKFSTCFDQNNSGIDSLININGYFTSISTKNLNRKGVSETQSMETSIDIMFFSNGVFAYNAIIPEKNNIDSSFFGSFYWGLYSFHQDTIKTHFLSRASLMAPWDGWEIWYLIIDRNTVKQIYKTPIHPMSKGDWAYYASQTLPKMHHGTYNFVPLNYVTEHYCWLKREKWFWCDESEWRAYMEENGYKIRRRDRVKR